MMTEEEGWDMHGLVAMESINSSTSVWHEFFNVLGILNMGVPKEFADHLLGLQKDPDQYFVEALFHIYKNNRALVDILHNLSRPPESVISVIPVELQVPYIRGSNETFKSYETNDQKAYQNRMKNKLREHFQKLF